MLIAIFSSSIYLDLVVIFLSLTFPRFSFKINRVDKYLTNLNSYPLS